MRMTHQISGSSPDICLYHSLLWALGTRRHILPSSVSRAGWGGHRRAVQWPECGAQAAEQCERSAESWPAGQAGGTRPGDLSETFPSRLFVTSSDNDFQLLWNMKNLSLEGNWGHVNTSRIQHHSTGCGGSSRSRLRGCRLGLRPALGRSVSGSGQTSCPAGTVVLHTLAQTLP